ncbi:MAG: hypothetical protein V4537_17590 [Pseudomonadota bacterium]
MILALLLAQAAAAPACPATPVRLPPDLAGWTSSGADLASMKAVALPTMDPATVRLADVALPKQPGRMALSTFRVKVAGTYGVALGAKGWIDLYRVGSRTALTTAKHGHGPACSGIRKIVRFALTPGEYRLAVGGLDAPQVKAMLVR